MVDGTEASGTTTPDPVGAQTSGTTGQGSVGATADAESLQARVEELQRKYEQSLREKSNLEEERRRRQELEQENAQLRSGYGTAPATGDPYQAAAAEMRQYYYALQQSDDPRDKITLANLNMTQQLLQQQQFEQDLSNSVPLDKHKEVRERALKSGLPPSVVYRAMKGDEADSRAKALAEKEAELEARRKRLDEEEAARRKGMVDVTTTPIPARDFLKGDYTPSDYARDCDAAVNGDQEARRRLDDFDSGRVQIKYG